jgi:hypothetical protein
MKKTKPNKILHIDKKKKKKKKTKQKIKKKKKKKKKKNPSKSISHWSIIFENKNIKKTTVYFIIYSDI